MLSGRQVGTLWIGRPGATDRSPAVLGGTSLAEHWVMVTVEWHSEVPGVYRVTEGLLLS